MRFSSWSRLTPEEECLYSAHQGFDHCSLVCCWVVRIKGEVLVHVCGLPVHLCADDAILLPGQEHIKERYLPSRFSLDSELNVWIYAVEILVEGIHQVTRECSARAIHIPPPKTGRGVEGGWSPGLKSYY